MSEIQKSLRILGLDPGSSKDAIQRRYKRLIMVWHPDRFPTAEGKEDAEEELKKINNARDLLLKHFDDGSHKASGCECTDGGSGSARTGPTNGAEEPGYSSGPSAAEQEAEARRRDDERRRRASAAREEHARKEREAEASRQQQQQPSNTQTVSDAQKLRAAAKDNSLRWKIAFAEVSLFIGILGFASAGLGLKSWWHDVSWKWQNDNPLIHKDNPPSNNYNDDSTTTNTGYVPPYMVPPSQSGTSSTPNVSPYENTAPPPESTIAPPPESTIAPTPDSNTVTPNNSTVSPGFNWKMTPNQTPSLSSPLLPGPSTTTAGSGSTLDYWSKLKTIPSTQVPSSTNTSTSTGVNQFDVDKYIKR